MNQKNVIVVAIAVVLIVVAGLLIYRQMGGGSAGTSTSEQKGILMLCTNCGNVFRDPSIRMAPADPNAVFKCPKCGKMAAKPATKCNHCGYVFIAGPKYMKKKPDGGMGLQCPKCHKFVDVWATNQ